MSTFGSLFPDNDPYGPSTGHGELADAGTPASYNSSQYDVPIGPVLSSPPAAAQPAFTPKQTPLGNGFWGTMGTFLSGFSPQGKNFLDTTADWQNKQTAFGQHQQGLDQEAQRTQLLKQQQDRQALNDGFTQLQNISKITNPTYRKAALQNFQQHAPRFFGGELPKELMDVYQKGTEEEITALNQAAEDYIKMLPPEVGGSGIGAYLRSHPEALPGLLGHAAEFYKAQQQAKTDQAILERSGNAPSGPQGGTSPQSGMSAPTQPNVAPGGSQGAPQARLQPASTGPVRGFGPVQQAIYDESVKQGVDPALALAIAEHESSFNFVSGDGGRARGYFQLHESAAKDASSSLGMRIEDRDTPEGNIKLGVQYIKQLLDRSGGNSQAALALYNWGRREYANQGSPTYVQDVGKGVERYNRIIGRPFSEAVASGVNDTERAAVQARTQAIEGLQQKIQNMEPLLGTSGKDKAKALIENWRDQIKTHQTEIDRIEKRYENNKPSEDVLKAGRKLGLNRPWQQWTDQEMKAAVAAAPDMAAEDAGLKSGAESAATKQDRMDVALAGNQGNMLGPDQAAKIRNTTGEGPLHPLGMTNTQIQEENAKTPGKWVTVTPMPEQSEEKMQTTMNGIRATQRIMKYLDDPEIAGLVGTIMSNPEGGFKKWVANHWGGQIPEKYREVVAEITGLTAPILHANIGGNQTVQEFARIKPLLQNMEAVDAPSLRASMRVLHNQLAEDFNDRLAGHQQRGHDVNPGWKPITLLETALDKQPATPPQPEPDAKPTAPGGSSITSGVTSPATTAIQPLFGAPPAPTAKGPRPKTNAARDYLKQGQ